MRRTSYYIKTWTYKSTIVFFWQLCISEQKFPSLYFFNKIEIIRGIMSSISPVPWTQVVKRVLKWNLTHTRKTIETGVYRLLYTPSHTHAQNESHSSAPSPSDRKHLVSKHYSNSIKIFHLFTIYVIVLMLFYKATDHSGFTPKFYQHWQQK